MARYISPEFFQDERVGAVSPYARLLLVGLWQCGDKQDRVPDRERWVRFKVFPHEPLEVAPMLSELSDVGLISRAEGFITVTPDRLLTRDRRAPRPARPTITVAVRNAVYARDQGRCCWCGSNHKLHFDHIVRYRDGGGETVENLRLLCQSCNLGRG